MTDWTAAEAARMEKIYADEREARRRENGPADRAARTRDTGHSVSLPEDTLEAAQHARATHPLLQAEPVSQIAPGAVPAQQGVMPPDVRPGSDWLSVLQAHPGLSKNQTVV